MNLDEALKHTAVIGAAGKMGSGISLLLAEEVALLEARTTGQVGKGGYRLDLIDTNPAALDALKVYLKSHLTQSAERQINVLREAFAKNPKLISNEDMVREFVQGALDIIHPGTSLEEAKDAVIVFEAVVEDLQIKSEIFHKLNRVCKTPFFVFSNTSSIPIHILNDNGDLHQRVIGFHFYNPPSVQKLIELIPLENGEPLLDEWARELAKRFKKIVVRSKDIAGFIGNGYLVREALFACAKVRELSQQFLPHQALYMVNKVTQDYLLRPMGIFQLLDYVGIDVASKIGKVMNAYLSCGSYDDDLIEAMVTAGVLGGQYPDGSQKNGFLQYDKHQVVGVYSLAEKRYIPFSEGTWKESADKAMGELPQSFVPWKNLHKDPKADEKIRLYFIALAQQKSLGASIAREFLYRDAQIAQVLVDDGVAHSLESVTTVLRNGFYHLYGLEEALKLGEKACAQ